MPIILIPKEKEVAESSVIIVTESSQLSGELLSDVMYEVHGTVDISGIELVVPDTGLNIRGLGVGVSYLTATSDNYTMFTSPVGGSGSLNITALELEVSGASSQLFDLVDATNFNVCEFSMVNFNNMTSMGELSGYRQGLELNTGRFGGTPTLTLSGNWVGGYRCSTSIVRGVGNTTTLFKAGVGFLMNNRFLTDINVVLPDGASVCDFSPANIAKDGDFQIFNGEFGGLSDKSQYFPNMPESSTKAFMKDNFGINNTFAGGVWELTTEIATPLTQNTYSRILGTATGGDLVHFSASSPNAFTYISSKSSDFTLTGNIKIDGGANDSIRTLVRVYRSATDTEEDGRSNIKQITNVVGGLDLAEFFIYDTFTLNQNDEVRLYMRNETDNTNATMKLGSILTINKR